MAHVQQKDVLVTNVANRTTLNSEACHIGNQLEKSHVHQVNTESLEISSSSDDEYLYMLGQDSL